MSKSHPASTPAPAVSRTRRAISIVFLFVALIVLAVELRAGLGQSRSVTALTGKASDGLFAEGVTFPEVESMMTLFPSVTLVRENEMEIVYRYHWQSLLRPLTQQPASEIYLVLHPSDPPTPVAFYTDKEDGEKGFYGDPKPLRAEEGASFPEDVMPPDPFGIPDAESTEPGEAKKGWPTGDASTQPVEPEFSEPPNEGTNVEESKNE